MFPVTVTIHNPGQLHAVLAAMQAVDDEPRTGGQASTDKPAAKEAGTPGKSDAKGASTSRTAAAAPTPAADALAKKDAESAAKLGVEGDAPAMTYEDVKKAILEVSKQKGREAALKLLAEFGAEKGPDLQKTPDQFGAFVIRAKALLA
jgi:hypothetical protein